MNLLLSTLIVLRFELKRSWSASRMAWWTALAAFPPLLLGLVRFHEGMPRTDQWPYVVITIYVLCPGVVSMLGVFLWASPALASELEGRSWVYLAVRPRGAQAVVLGKYLAAVAWTLPAAMVAATASVFVFVRDDLSRWIWMEWRLSLLSCLAYGAVFSLIGVLVPKRAMVIGMLYVAVFEVVLALIPATVNLFTFQYRLRCILVRWMDLDASMVGDNPVELAYFGEESARWHVAVMLVMTLGVLVAALAAVQWKEFTAESESDV